MIVKGPPHLGTLFNIDNEQPFEHLGSARKGVTAQPDP